MIFRPSSKAASRNKNANPIEKYRAHFEEMKKKRRSEEEKDLWHRKRTIKKRLSKRQRFIRRCQVCFVFSVLSSWDWDRVRRWRCWHFKMKMIHLLKEKEWPFLFLSDIFLFPLFCTIFSSIIFCAMEKSKGKSFFSHWLSPFPFLPLPSSSPWPFHWRRWWCKRCQIPHLHWWRRRWWWQWYWHKEILLAAVTTTTTPESFFEIRNQSQFPLLSAIELFIHGLFPTPNLEIQIIVISCQTEIRYTSFFCFSLLSLFPIFLLSLHFWSRPNPFFGAGKRIGNILGLLSLSLFPFPPTTYHKMAILLAYLPSSRASANLNPKSPLKQTQSLAPLLLRGENGRNTRVILMCPTTKKEANMHQFNCFRWCCSKTGFIRLQLVLLPHFFLLLLLLPQYCRH